MNTPGQRTAQPSTEQSKRKTITVLVADDHPLYRDSVARLVNSRDSMVVVGSAADGNEALKLIRELLPDVCLLDHSMPGLNGEQIVKIVTAEHLPTRTMVLSGTGRSELVFGVIEAGANGFLLKTSGPDEICTAIVALADGETVLPVEFHKGLAAEIRARHASDTPELSPRELGILKQLAEGSSAASIGEQLGLAPSTVKTHLARIYDKLGVSERAAAVATAMRHGLID